MDKQQAVDIVKKIGASRIIGKEELDLAYDEGARSGVPEISDSKRSRIANILFYVGGGIVFLGVAILIGENWNALGSLVKIISTLGISILAYFLGLFFSRDKKLNILKSVSYFISAILMPVGLGVIFNLAGFNIASAGIQSLISAILLSFYLLSYFLAKEDIFLLFSIIFGTWLFFALTDFIVAGKALFGDKFMQYRVLLAALSYLFLGYYFSNIGKKGLRSFLYGVGIFAFLGIALVLGGWRPNQNIVWELIYPFLIVAVLLLSVYLKSNSFLVFGSLYLVGYIFKITSEYFSRSLGWPLALLVAGLLIIAAGYSFFYIRKKITPDVLK
ncbi:MAG: hypothetical protein PHG23_00200 [Candidatus Pacebacteria bacterium]|nr:hypothetical protein [Candidatus Paceibacterota bacterium]